MSDRVQAIRSTAIRPRSAAWIALATAMLLVMGPTTGSVAAEYSMNLDEDARALSLRITDLAVEQGALSPETAASLYRLFDSNTWASVEDANTLLNQAASELASAPHALENEEEDGLQQELELFVGTRLNKPDPRRLISSSPDIPTSPPNPDPNPTPGGGGSCAKDCKTEHNWCYVECALIYLACVAASSGWGALACFFLYLVCIARCDEEYEICMRQCEDSDASMAATDVYRRDAFPVHDSAAVITGFGGTQRFSSQPTLALSR